MLGFRRSLTIGCALPQAGTLSGNPLAMTAGLKTLEILARPGAYEQLDKVTGRLINGILDAAKETGHDMCGGHISGAPSLQIPLLIHLTVWQHGQSACCARLHARTLHPNRPLGSIGAVVGYC